MAITLSRDEKNCIIYVMYPLFLAHCNSLCQTRESTKGDLTECLSQDVVTVMVWGFSCCFLFLSSCVLSYFTLPVFVLYPLL